MYWYLEMIAKELPQITSNLAGIEYELHCIDKTLGVLTISFWGFCILYLILQAKRKDKK